VDIDRHESRSSSSSSSSSSSLSLCFFPSYYSVSFTSSSISFKLSAYCTHLFNIMRPVAANFLANLVIASANLFLDDPGGSGNDVNAFDIGLSSRPNLAESPSIFTSEKWNAEATDSVLLAEWARQNPEALLGGADSNLPISDNWAYQLDGGASINGCDALTTSRTRSKRLQDECPAPEPEKEKKTCGTDLYPHAFCCLGPEFAALVLVNRCAPCRWSPGREIVRN
jgi:hypothetical protein